MYRIEHLYKHINIQVPHEVKINMDFPNKEKSTRCSYPNGKWY